MADPSPGEEASGRPKTPEPEPSATTSSTSAEPVTAITTTTNPGLGPAPLLEPEPAAGDFERTPVGTPVPGLAVHTADFPQLMPLPPSHWAQPPDGDPDDERDSAFGDVQSSTASLSASIYEYRTLHGRTYHSERGNALAWVPNDEPHMESMDINHHLLTKCLGDKLHLAPLNEDIQSALDIGTGTGIWAIDFADQYPSAEVVGTDVSPMQPSWIPPNLRFEIENACDEWTFKPESFDYVHIRYMLGSVPDWAKMFKEAYRVLKPGGWIESHECSANVESDDGTVREGSAMDQWGKIFWEAGKKMKRNFRVLEENVQVKSMEEAGFTELKVWNLKAPIGNWPADLKKREIGDIAEWAMTTDLEGYVLYACNKVLGWSREEVQIYLAHLRKEMRSKRIHGYYRQRVVYARKPET